MIDDTEPAPDRSGTRRTNVLRRVLPILGACLAGLAAAAMSDLYNHLHYLTVGVATAALIVLCVGGTLAIALRYRVGLLAAMMATSCLIAIGGLWLLRDAQEAQPSLIQAALANSSSPAVVDGLRLRPAVLGGDGAIPEAIADRFEQNRELIERLAGERGLELAPFLTQLSMLAARDDVGRFNDVYLMEALGRDVSEMLAQMAVFGDGPPAEYGQISTMMREGQFARARASILEGLDGVDLPAAWKLRLLVAQAGLEQVGLQYGVAARHFREAADLSESDDLRVGLEFAALTAFYRDGAMWQKRDSLEAASDIASAMVDAGSERTADAIAYQLEIARALRSLPSETGDPLGQANAILLQAIASVSRMDAPGMLAKLQLERGIVLRQAAASPPDEAKLRQAIEALQLAQAPAAQNDTRMAGIIENELGLASRQLAEIDRAERQSMSAVMHFRRALDLLKDSAIASDLNALRINLAVALRTVGMARKDAALLDEAIVSFETALAELDLGEGGLDLVAARTGLAIALLAKGETFNDISALERAVVEYKAALEGAQTDGRLSSDWAKTQNGLANALQSLGERTNRRSTLEEALAAREGAWVLYQFSGLDSYDFYFENRIATQRTYLETMPVT